MNMDQNKNQQNRRETKLCKNHPSQRQKLIVEQQISLLMKSNLKK